MENGPLISLIIPVYNEESLIVSSIQTLVDFLQTSAFPYRYHITIVDNGSIDTTLVRAQKLAQIFPAEVSVLSLTEKGKGHAIREGWKLPGDVLAFMDVDLSSDLSFFRPLIDAIVVANNDLAIGNRLGKKSRIYGRRMTREVASRIYNYLVRVLFGSRLQDHQCGFKAIRAEVYARIAPRLEERGWLFDTELLVLAQRGGYSIYSLDIYWNDSRDSKVSLGNTSKQMFVALLAFRRRLGRSIR